MTDPASPDRHGRPLTVRVLYFGGLRERFTNTKLEEVPLPEGATIAQLLDELCVRYPGLEDMRGRVRVAVNEEVVPDAHALAAGDEIALLPPVAGGADPWCRLSEQPLDPAEVLRAVAGPGYGAVVTFIGLVRNHNDGRAVTRLEYHAYESMALKSFAGNIDRCEANVPGTRVAIAHRTGLLEIGDIAVIVAAAASHRAEAFRAARMCIELLKRETPIWKKEISPDGEEWIGMTP